MNGRIAALSIVVLFAVVVGGAGAVDLPYSQDFEGGVEALRADGWRLRANATLTDDNPRGGDLCLGVDVTDPARFPSRYAELFIPVEAGKFYQAEVWIRAQEVQRHPDAGSNRGAVLFLQWADHNRSHVSGGSFPRGLHGDHDWTHHKVNFTYRIPENVGYLHVLLGVEGQGTAWFDDLVVREIEAGWAGPEVTAPAEGAMLDNRRPVFEWQDLAPGGLAYALELSRDPAFPTAETLVTQSVGTTARPAAWLEPGAWHYRIIPSTGRDAAMPPPRSFTFTLAADSVAWPPDIEPRWAWSDAPRPVLEAYVGPAGVEAEVLVTINGEDAEMLEHEGETVRFRPAADLPEGIHEVRIEAFHVAEKTVAAEGIFNNKRPGSRVEFRDDNVTLVDGEPFFALGAYRDPSDRIDEFSGLVEAGFNLTHDYLFEHAPQPVETARAYLDGAHERGIKVFLGLSRAKLHEGDLPWIQRWVAELMDHPAVLTWYLMDEPEIRGLSAADMRRVHEAIRMVDPFRPTSVVYCRPPAFADWADAQDLHWNDPYPLPNRPLTMVEDWVRLGREAVGPDRPVWTVLQGHDYRFWRDPQAAFAEHGKPSQPTREHTRCMTFMALAAGTDGLVWYWGPRSKYRMKEDAPEKWAGIVETVQLLNALQPWLTARGTDGDAVEVAEPFRAWSRVADGTRVMAVVNTAADAAQLSVDLAALGAQDVQDFETGEAVALTGTRLIVQLAPHEVRIYRWNVALP